MLDRYRLEMEQASMIIVALEKITNWSDEDHKARLEEKLFATLSKDPSNYLRPENGSNIIDLNND